MKSGIVIYSDLINLFAGCRYKFINIQNVIKFKLIKRRGMPDL